MRELREPAARLVEDGRVGFGTYDRPIPELNLIDAQPWAWPMPRALRALRLKEWQAVQFGNARYFVLVALFDAKLMGIAQVKIYDRERRKKYMFERKLPGWTLHSPKTLLDSSMAWAGGGARIAFHNHLREDSIDIEIEVPASADHPGVSGRVRADMAGCEPEVVCIPFAENRGMYSHKGCFAVEGQLRLGDETLEFSPADSFLLLDDHKGYYPRVMRWDWVTGGGVDAKGRRIGFNLTRNDSIDPDRFNENCLWIDGRRHLLPPVTFVRRPELSPEVWEVRDLPNLGGAGEVAVDFVIELDGHVRVNALVIESRYRGPFGHVQGTLLGPDAEVIELDGMFGMGEDFHLRC